MAIVRCDLCATFQPADTLLDHIRLMHPDDYEELAVWPDGSPVIIDNTLEPEDFEERTLP